MFDENSNATAAATLVGPAGTNTALHTANLNSTHLFNQLLNVKDSRWLQLEVCREFQRGQCSRSDVDCKFAHPPQHVDVQNGRVTACYDSIKGRCTRENPRCKYLHPPQHLKDQLLINGRNNLAIKNLLSAQIIQPAAIPNNLQMAQLMQQSQPMQLPYQQYYSPLTAIYPIIPTGNPADFQTLSPVAQQLALLQSQQLQQKQQVAAAISPLSNTPAATLAAHQYQQQFAQALLQQHLATSQQSQAVPSLQSQLYGSGGGSPALTNQALTNQALTQQALQQQLQLQQHLASHQQFAASQQQAALLAALTAQQQAVQQAQSQSQTQQTPNPLENRKRNARVAGFEENGNGEEKKSTSSAQSSSATNGSTALSIATTTASLQQPPNVAEIAAFQQQLLLLNSINANAANASAANATVSSNGMPNGKRHMDKNGLPTNGHAIPIYAQQPTGPQFGPYIGYAPVSYSGQLPPRF